MDVKKLEEILKSTGYPVAYSNFKKPPQPPYIIYWNINKSNIYADDKIYFSNENYQIELYTMKKDYEVELTLENILDNAGLIYEVNEAWIDSIKLNQRVYEIQI